jgi:chromate transporter
LSSSIVVTAAPEERHGVSFREAFWVWLRVAALSFGGPAGQIAVMHRILVEEKRWIGETGFLHALNYCMLLPGPEAQQLAVYIGWLLHRIPGGLVAGTLFILPGYVSLMVLSWLYAAYGDIGFVQALFFGLKAAVLAIVVEAVFKVGKRALKNRVMIGLAGLSFITIFFFHAPFPLIILAAAFIGFVGHSVGFKAFSGSFGHGEAKGGNEEPAAIDRAFAEQIPDHVRPSSTRAIKITVICLVLWLGPVVTLIYALGWDNVFSNIGLFFSKMAVITFGGAYAVLAYMAQQAVEYYHWLQPGEMLVGLGMAETTPGPLISVVQFVGFMAAFRHPGALDPMVAAALGGTLAKWTTFVPCFLWIFLGGPYMEALRGNKALTASLSAITAAVVGVILNLAVWFAIHTVFREVEPVRAFLFAFDAPKFSSVDPWALLLSVGAAVAIFRFKVGMIPTLATCCLAGMVLFYMGMLS